MKTIYERIKHARSRRALTQADMAVELGLRQGAYCLLETGKSPLTVERLLQICRILNLPVPYFFNEDLESLIDKQHESIYALMLTNEENAMELTLPSNHKGASTSSSEDTQKNQIIAALHSELAAMKRVIALQETEIHLFRRSFTRILRHKTIKKLLKTQFGADCDTLLTLNKTKKA